MIIHGNEVKQKMLQGISIVADTVKPTLGPQAKTVILEGHPPVIINDGVTITKYISHEDPYVRMGIQLVQNLAAKAQDSSGDGTTTACILAQALCENIIKHDTDDVHSLRRSLEDARNIVLNGISDQAIQVDDESIEQVATIAANNDPTMGELIAEVLGVVGRDGVVTVEEGHSLETVYEIKEGLEIDEGYFSHLMGEEGSGIAELQNPLVLCTNRTLTYFKELYPVLELAASKGRPLLIFCKNIQGTALSNILMNIMQGRIECCVVKAPNFGDAQLDELTDITSLLGGKVFTDESDDDISTATLKELGGCEKAIITGHTTTLIGGEEDASEKIAELRTRFDELEGNYERARIKKRLSRLQGGVAVIRVGAGSSIEMRETKERLDDALNATKAALQEGIVLGGGKTLFALKQNLSDELIGHKIVKEALEAPLVALLSNGNKALTFDMRSHLENEASGYDAVTGEMCDLTEKGIFDPAKVTRSSFSAAMSIASLFLSTEVAVLRPEE